MGAFHIQIGDGPAIILPNCVHVEGLKARWRSAFIGGPVKGFRIGLTGLNIPGKVRIADDRTWTAVGDITRRPNLATAYYGAPFPAYFPKIGPRTTYADIRRPLANPDGRYPYTVEGGEGGIENGENLFGNTAHERIMVAMIEQETVFTGTTKNYSGEVASSLVTFKNWANASWGTSVNSNTGNPSYYEKDATGAPDAHGFPYCTPKLWCGETDPVIDVWATVAFISQEEAQLEDPPTDAYYLLEWESETNVDVPGSGWVHCFAGYGEWPIIKGGYYTVRSEWAPSSYVSAVDAYIRPTFRVRIRPQTALAALVDSSPWYGASLPLRSVYICTDEPNPKLIASASFADDVSLVAGATLKVSYHGRIAAWVPGMDTLTDDGSVAENASLLSEAFGLVMAQRMFASASTWTVNPYTNWEVGLGRVNLSELKPDAAIDALLELTAEDNPGYARAPVVLTQDDTGAYGPTYEFAFAPPAFTNSGENPWQVVNVVFLVWKGGTTPKWAFAQSAASLVLAPGESFTPWGLVEDDNLMVIQGRPTDRGEPETTN